MKAIVLAGPGAAEIRELPIPRPGPGEALIRVRFVVLCGTDKRIFSGLMHDAEYPLVPGHEWIGTVESDLTGRFDSGAWVCGSNFLVCHKCSFCLSGHEELCPHMDELGMNRQGACAEFLSIPSNNLKAAPEPLHRPGGCLVEPLAVALHACAQVNPDTPCIVVGAGGLGLLAAQVLRSRGTQVLVVDPSADRRDKASRLELDAYENVAAARSALSAATFIDATGSAKAFEEVIDAAAPLDRLVLVGYSSDEEVLLQPANIMLKELQVQGVLSGYGLLGDAVREIATGSVLVDEIIDDHFLFDDWKDAVAVLNRPDASRVALAFNDQSQLKEGLHL